jgi:pimeloyl-ACP methyl ester carboxylesterase
MGELEKVKFFHNNELSVEYGVWGSGTETMLCFHGFGRSYRDFIEFTEPLKSRYTIYGINIFFHGKSEIGERNVDKKPITKAEFKEFFEKFIDAVGEERVTLMGYSLGGRVSMRITELLPERVRELYLYAPDGLVVSRWYAMLSHYRLGRTAFRFFIRHNTGFYSLLDFLNKTGLVSDRLREFVLNETSSQEKQWKVYRVWSFLRKSDPNLSKLSKKLKQENIPVKVFIGKYDKIIPLKNTNRLKKMYPETEVFTVESGHALLTKRVMNEIRKRDLLGNMD